LFIPIKFNSFEGLRVKKREFNIQNALFMANLLNINYVYLAAVKTRVSKDASSSSIVEKVGQF